MRKKKVQIPEHVLDYSDNIAKLFLANPCMTPLQRAKVLRMFDRTFEYAFRAGYRAGVLATGKAERYLMARELIAIDRADRDDDPSV